MKNNISLLFALSRADTVMARRLSGHGLSFSDFVILHHLDQAPGRKLRRIDLAHKLGLTPSGITRMLLPLEKLGIITRDQSEEDARARFASLTKAGEELFKDATSTLKMKLEDIIPIDHKSNIKDFIAFLDTITENMLQPEYKQEAKQRWSNSEAYKQSAERVKKMSQEDLERIKNENEKLTRAIADSMQMGVSSPKVQALIDQHYAGLKNFYEPNLELYQNLGEMYANDPRFSAYYEKFAPGLAKFMRDAIKIYCSRKK